MTDHCLRCEDGREPRVLRWRGAVTGRMYVWYVHFPEDGEPWRPRLCPRYRPGEGGE